MQPEVPDKATAPPGLPLPVELEYTLDQDDWVDYYVYSWEQQPRPRFPIRLAITSLILGTLTALPFFGLFVALPFFALGGKVPEDPEVRPLFVIMLLLCLGIVLVAASIIVYYTRSKKQTRKVQRVQAENLVRQQVLHGYIWSGARKQVRLTEEGFVETDDFRDSGGGVEAHGRIEYRVPWGAVAGVHVTERLALLLVGEKGTLIVPRRIFADEAALSGFLDTVASLRRRASESPTRHPAAGQQGQGASGITLAPGPPPDDRITR